MQQSADIEELVTRWFSAASSGDASLVDAHVSQSDDVRLIGSDPDEWFEGGSAISAFLKGEVDGTGGQVSFMPQRIEAFREGSVGWATTSLTISRPDGMHIEPRWSAVFHLEGDVWKIVQTHVSIAVPNADVGWVYD